MYGMFYPWKIERLFGVGDGHEDKSAPEGEKGA